jgi:hypothetical protein
MNSKLSRLKKFLKISLQNKVMSLDSEIAKLTVSIEIKIVKINTANSANTLRNFVEKRKENRFNYSKWLLFHNELRQFYGFSVFMAPQHEKYCPKPQLTESEKVINHSRGCSDKTSCCIFMERSQPSLPPYDVLHRFSSNYTIFDSPDVPHHLERRAPCSNKVNFCESFYSFTDRNENKT